MNVKIPIKMTPDMIKNLVIVATKADPLGVMFSEEWKKDIHEQASKQIAAAVKKQEKNNG